jgi:hypothetical protein
LVVYLKENTPYMTTIIECDVSLWLLVW